MEHLSTYPLWLAGAKGPQDPTGAQGAALRSLTR